MGGGRVWEPRSFIASWVALCQLQLYPLTSCQLLGSTHRSLSGPCCPSETPCLMLRSLPLPTCPPPSFQQDSVNPGSVREPRGFLCAPKRSGPFSVLHHGTPLTLQVILASRGENLLGHELECMSHHAGQMGNSMVSAEGRQDLG